MLLGSLFLLFFARCAETKAQMEAVLLQLDTLTKDTMLR